MVAVGWTLHEQFPQMIAAAEISVGPGCLPEFTKPPTSWILIQQLMFNNGFSPTLSHIKQLVTLNPISPKLLSPSLQRLPDSNGYTQIPYAYLCTYHKLFVHMEPLLHYNGSR